MTTVRLFLVLGESLVSSFIYTQKREIKGNKSRIRSGYKDEEPGNTRLENKGKKNTFSRETNVTTNTWLRP